MPRFTNDPGTMSRATRRARSSRPSGLPDVWRSAWLPVRRLWSLVGMLISGHLHNAVDVDAGGHDVFRVQASGGDDPGDLGDGVFRGGGHDGAEVPRGFTVDQVAPAVRREGLDQGDVGVDGGLEHLPLAVQEAGFLAFGEHGAVAGGREETADPGAGGTDPLGEVSLRDQFELNLAGAVLRVEMPGVGLPREGTDHLLHPA